MIKIKGQISRTLAICLLLVLISCRPGDVPKPEPTVEEGTISGIATLGPIVDGDVTAYIFSEGSRRNELNTALTKTNASGQYTVNLKIDNAPILVCIKNGAYKEAASTTGNDIFFKTEELCAVANYKQGITQTIAITYFTHLAYAYSQFLALDNKDTAAVVNQANTEISNWLGTDIITTEPADIINSVSTFNQLTPELKYGFSNSAISSLMDTLNNQLAIPQSPITDITSLIFSQRAFGDLKFDGVLDGISISGKVDIGSVFLTANEYKNLLAKNIIAIATSNQNLSVEAKANLIAYGNKFAVYKGAIFTPKASNKPVISIIAPSDSIILKGLITVRASITASVPLKQVIVTLLNDIGTIMTPVVPVATDLNNVNISLDSTLYADGNYSIEITALNANGGTTIQTIYNLTFKNRVSTGNTAPVAMVDKYTIAIGKTIKPFMVLQNDTDADRPVAGLTAVLVTRTPTATGASITSNATNTGFIYTPSATVKSSTDVFSYYAYDGMDVSNVVTVTVLAIKDSVPNILITNPVNSVWYSPNNGMITFPVQANIEIIGLALGSISDQFGTNAAKVVTQSTVNSPFSISLDFIYSVNALSDGLYDYTIFAKNEVGSIGQNSVQIGIDTSPPIVNFISGPFSIPPTVIEQITPLPTISAAFKVSLTVSDPGFPTKGSGIASATLSTNLENVTATTNLVVNNGKVSNINKPFEFTLPLGSVPAVKYTGKVLKTRIYDVTARCSISRNYGVLPIDGTIYTDGELRSSTTTVPNALLGKKMCYFKAGTEYTFYTNDVIYKWVLNVDSYRLFQVQLSNTPTPVLNIAQVTVDAVDNTVGALQTKRSDYCLQSVAANNFNTNMVFVNGVIPATGAGISDLYLQAKTGMLSFPPIPFNMILDKFSAIKPTSVKACIAVKNPEPVSTPTIFPTDTEGSAIQCKTESGSVSVDFVENTGTVMKNPATGSGVMDAFTASYSSPTPTANGCF